MVDYTADFDSEKVNLTSKITGLKLYYFLSTGTECSNRNKYNSCTFVGEAEAVIRWSGALQISLKMWRL